MDVSVMVRPTGGHVHFLTESGISQTRWPQWLFGLAVWRKGVVVTHRPLGTSLPDSPEKFLTRRAQTPSKGQESDYDSNEMALVRKKRCVPIIHGTTTRQSKAQRINKDIGKKDFERAMIA